MPRRKVLLVGWDAADWKVIQPLLDRGEMPVLARLVGQGVMGNLASIRPMLSPMLWNSIATGKRPYQHGVHGFTEIDPELQAPAPVSSQTRRCRAVWELLNAKGLKTHVVGWFATHPAEALDGVCVSDRFSAPAPLHLDAPWPVAEGTVSPERLAGALAELRVRPEEIDGGTLKLFVPEAAQIDQRYDKRLHQLAIRLAECFSIHAAATYLVENEPWDFAAVYHRSIDWISHDFMNYHPPRMPGINVEEFRLYRHAVEGIYRLHDALLGRLLTLAGEETTVMIVSDHGFHSDNLRPAYTPDVPAGIADWHRPSGVLAMRGAGLRADELIHGASLLDVTPTILALFGLPTGRDMDGRVLVEAFTDAPEVRTIESWETASGLRERSGGGRRSAAEESAVVRQFVDLGYLEDPGDDPADAVRNTERENQWNLARAYLDARRYADALPLLEAVYEAWPERRDYCFELALCQLNLGLSDEAWETAEALTEHAASGAADALLLANIEFRRGNYYVCLDHLAMAEADNSRLAGLQNQIGLTHLRLKRWDAAEAAYRRALENDADDPYAHLGLAHSQLRTGQYEQAAQSALSALGLRFDLALGHYFLGIAVARLGDAAKAAQAFETALRYQPGWTAAHRYLASLYGRLPDGAAKVAEHRAHLNTRPVKKEAWAKTHADLRRGVVERARGRDEARRRRRERRNPAASAQATTPATYGPLDFLIVSGLPRSGTSLMMQILAAGGLGIMRDDLRPADADNPHGYYEWQEIKKLAKNPFLIEKAHGRVTKVISMLLPFLPRRHRFRVIFMVRPLEDTVASQAEMLRRRKATPSAADADKMAAELAEHRARMLALLRESANVELLEVSYAELLREPVRVCGAVARFAGLEPEPVERMAAVIDPKLCHHGLMVPA